MKKGSTGRKKLRLRRHTIRHLDTTSLEQVVGANTNGQCSGTKSTDTCILTEGC